MWNSLTDFHGSLKYQTSNESVLLELREYRISPPIRRTVIFSLEILEKNNDECTFYWKNTGLLHIKTSNHNTIYSSQKPRKLSLSQNTASFSCL